ncbi:MAG: C/D box methylation guide ribonucleoprotein complex aNOP56 subunit, partial [Candidatus Lokiarchaeota archaeon]
NERKLTEWFISFMEELKSSGFDEYIFDNDNLKILSENELGYNTEFDPSILDFKNFRMNLSNQLKKVGYHKGEKEILLQFKKVSEDLVKDEVSKIAGETDQVIIQVIETLDTLKKSISLLSNKLKEWYGIHFPELIDQIIDDNVFLAELTAKIGDRKDFTETIINQKFDFSPNLLEKLVKTASMSMGADIEVKIIQEFAEKILSLNSYTETLELYLDDLMEKTAPNMKALIGSLIGAKLISKAGSLRKLAFMPASRIQLLGAETALYRHLSSGDKLPKHGIIFQWQQIRSNPPWIRGNIARLIAGKLGLAAKIDYFSGDFIGDEFSQEIEEKIKEIKEKYPKPPQSKEQNIKRKHRRRKK